MVLSGEKLPLFIFKAYDERQYGTLQNVEEDSSSLRKSLRESRGVYFQNVTRLGIFRHATKFDILLLCCGLLLSLISGFIQPLLGLTFGSMTNVFVRLNQQVLNSTILFEGDSPPKMIGVVRRTRPEVLHRDNGDEIVGVIDETMEIYDLHIPNYVRQLFNNSASSTPISTSELNELHSILTWIFALLGILSFVISFLQTISWEVSSIRQANRLRMEQFSKILKLRSHVKNKTKDENKKEIGKLELKTDDAKSNSNKEAVGNNIENVATKFRDCAGSKCTLITQYSSTFVVAIMVGINIDLVLTACILAFSIVYLLISCYLIQVEIKSNEIEDKMYKYAAAVASEVFSNVKTVLAFGNKSFEVKRYDSALEEGRKLVRNTYRLYTFLFALKYFVYYCTYGLAFWYGSNLIQNGSASPGTMFTIFLVVISGLFSIENSLKFGKLFADGSKTLSENASEHSSAAVEEEAFFTGGNKLIDFSGSISFENVTYNHPIMKLDRLNFDFRQGKKYAIVETNELRQSIFVDLVLRNLDSNEGNICLDDVKITNLDLNWYRSHIGVVCHDTTLFDRTFYENILVGMPDAKIFDIVDVARLTNAHQLIRSLPKGYDSTANDIDDEKLAHEVIPKVLLMRALIRKPKVLLVKDTHYPFKFIQDIFEMDSQGQTTIVITDQMSRVKLADFIYIMEDGRLIECGTHDELMKLQGRYHSKLSAEILLNEKLNENAINGESDDFISDSSSSTSSSDLENDQKVRVRERPTALLQRLRRENSRISNADSHSEEDEGDWKVLERTVSEELIEDDGDDEYETVVTVVRETRELLYSTSEGSEDDDQDNSLLDLNVSNAEEDQELEPTSDTDNKPKKVNKKRRKHPRDKRSKSPIGKQSTSLDLQTSEKCGVGQMNLLRSNNFPLLLVGGIGCVGVGIILPILAFYYGQVYKVATSKGIILERNTIIWTYMFLLLAVYAFIVYWAQVKGMIEIGLRFAQKARFLVFKNALEQTSSLNVWFEMEGHAALEMCSILSRDISHFNRFVGLKAGQMISAIISLVGTLLLSFYFGWMLSLILLISAAILFGTNYLQEKIKNKNVTSNSTRLNTITKEATENLKTIEEYNLQNEFISEYSKNLKIAKREEMKNAFLYSALCGFSKTITCSLYALAFRAGSYFVEVGNMQPADIYRVFFAIFFWMNMSGIVFSTLRDFHTLRNILQFLRNLPKPYISADSKKEDTSLTPDTVAEGEICFNRVYFCYQSESFLLYNLNLVIKPSSSVAFFGDKNCGNDVIIPLLLGLFSPSKGKIKINGIQPKSDNTSLRKNVGCVLRENVIFANRTIRENILYGGVLVEKDNAVIDDLVIAASLAAAAHDFIMALPMGYETIPVLDGIELTPSEKHRICVARALVTKPKIFLYVEPEEDFGQIVTESINFIRKNTTWITFTDKITSTEDFDEIIVLHDGRVLEKGSFAQLIERKGYYYHLQKTKGCLLRISVHRSGERLRQMSPKSLMTV